MTTDNMNNEMNDEMTTEVTDDHSDCDEDAEADDSIHSNDWIDSHQTSLRNNKHKISTDDQVASEAKTSKIITIDSTSNNSINSHKQLLEEITDATVKLLRLLANLSIDESIGKYLATRIEPFQVNFKSIDDVYVPL